MLSNVGMPSIFGSVGCGKVSTMASVSVGMVNKLDVSIRGANRSVAFEALAVSTV